ncbi:MAG TPA: lysylphosphatidylglycerol synthase transmembrane domain-containing protein [Gemmatimonadaceae bacterium]|nr:lysylphosphatidylglycerol synthase transmembrane domain-containing protein [Gemmatimonadaceae bacterium]
MTSPAPQPSMRARVLRWLLAIITIGLLVRLGVRVAWSDVWATAVRASPAWLLVATLVNLATPAVRGFRWWVFLRAVGSPSVPLAVHAAYVGSGLNNLLPASGGDPARALLVARRTSIPSATALATLTVDRVVEIATYLVVLLAVPLLLSVPPALRHAQAVSGLILGALLIAAFVAIRVAKGRGTSASNRGKIRSFIVRFVTGVTELPTAGRVVPAMLLSLVAWGLQGATYHLTAVATGLPVSFGASIVGMLAVNLSFLLPLTPGNVGVFQVVYAVTLGAYGISSDAAVATALLLQAVQILPMTALALVLAPDLLFRRARPGLP